MKKVIVAVFLVVLIISGLLVGCSAKISPLVEFVKLLPYGTNSIVYIDVGTMAEDPNLTDMYSSFRDKWIELEEDWGISISSVRVLGLAYSIDSAAVIIKGDFNLNDVRNALQKSQKIPDLTEDVYEGVSIWTGDSYILAFPEDMFIMGSSIENVKTFIELSQGKGTSIYDDELIKTIVDRLPTGINTMIQKGNGAPTFIPKGDVPPDVSIRYGLQYLAGGISLMKSTNAEGTLYLEGWYKFESAAAAEAGMAGLEDHVKHVFDVTNISSQLNGEFIKLTGEADLNLIQIFFW